MKVWFLTDDDNEIIFCADRQAKLADYKGVEGFNKSSALACWGKGLKYKGFTCNTVEYPDHLFLDLIKEYVNR